MIEVDMLDLATKMKGPSGTGKVFVLDVDHASTKYSVTLGIRTTRHAYYLRPPDGMHASDLKKVLDEAGGEEELAFRYFIYPELQMELKPLLTADPFAGKYFDRNDEHRFLQIEGERPVARERIARLLSGFKAPFNPADFPRINEFVLSSYRPGSADRHAELLLHRKDGIRNEIRLAEPGFHIAVAEHGFAKEIDIHRPVVAETEPTLIISSNQATTESGHRFLADLAAYFGSDTYADHVPIAPKALVEVTEPVKTTRAAIPVPNSLKAPVAQPAKQDETLLVTKVTNALKQMVPSMKLLKKREVTRSGPLITIPFPGVFGIGKGPSQDEIKELQHVFRALHGDPSIGSGWHAAYQVDPKTGEVKILATYDSALKSGWIQV